MALAIPMTAPAWAIALALCALLLATPAQAAVFVVNSAVDSVDALPGDGVCADASGACTLRAAVMETNALAGPDVVNLPGGTYPSPSPAPARTQRPPETSMFSTISRSSVPARTPRSSTPTGSTASFTFSVATADRMCMSLA